MRTSVHVHNFLQEKGMKHEVFLSGSPCKTAKEAATLLGLNPSEVVKSVLFLVKKEPVLIILPGSEQVSYEKLKKFYDTSRVYLADVGKVADLTGYVVGATPPVAHEHKLEVLMDKKALKNDVVYTGAGEIGAILKIKPHDLVEATDAKVVDIT